MALQPEISETMKTNTTGEFCFTVVFRHIEEEGDSYFVAECLELPGCLSQGATKEEAQANIQDAMQACFSVIFEDTVKQLIAHKKMPDLSGISSQQSMRIIPKPCLEYA